jgi:werner syndrome-like exonuclease
LKVGICISNDAWKVSNDYNVHVQPLKEISALANMKLAGPAKKWSLSSLTETITCKEVLLFAMTLFFKYLNVCFW